MAAKVGCSSRVETCQLLGPHSTTVPPPHHTTVPHNHSNSTQNHRSTPCHYTGTGYPEPHCSARRSSCSGQRGSSGFLEEYPPARPRYCFRSGRRKSDGCCPNDLLSSIRTGRPNHWALSALPGDKSLPGSACSCRPRYGSRCRPRSSACSRPRRWAARVWRVSSRRSRRAGCLYRWRRCQNFKKLF